MLRPGRSETRLEFLIPLLFLKKGLQGGADCAVGIFPPLNGVQRMCFVTQESKFKQQKSFPFCIFLVCEILSVIFISYSHLFRFWCYSISWFCFSHLSDRPRRRHGSTDSRLKTSISRCSSACRKRPTQDFSESPAWHLRCKYLGLTFVQIQVAVKPKLPLICNFFVWEWPCFISYNFCYYYYYY